MTYHVPMCKVCGEWEVGTFTGSAEYCSVPCEENANEFLNDISNERAEEREAYNAEGDGWGYEDCMAMYDDDPNPYAGTYSED